MAPVIKVDLDRLQASLLTSGLSQSNNALFQVISQLIKSAKQMQDIINARIEIISNLVADATFLTVTDEVSSLPNSRRIVAGTDISFDETTPGQLIINSNGITTPEVAARVSVRI